MSINLRSFPGNVFPDVSGAQAKPPDKNFDLLASNTAEKLKETLYPDAASIHFFPCMKEGLYECTWASFFKGNALVCVNGPLSQEWFDIGKTLGFTADLFDTPYGKSMDETLLEQRLKARKYDEIFITEIDPYTGTMVNIPEISKIIREIQPEALTVVDCTASIGCVLPLKLNQDADIIIAGSECALGVPPGLGIIVMGQRASLQSLTISGSGCYFNFNYQQQLKREKLLSPMVPYPLLYSLDKQLDRIKLEGLDERIAHIKEIGEKAEHWAEKNKFRIFPDRNVAAPTVTVFHCLEQISPEELIEYLNNFGILLGSCPGELAKEYIIFAHMNNDLEDLEAFYAVMAKFLKDYDTRTNLPKFRLFKRENLE